MKLSIVTTLYKSSLYIDEFYIRISKEAQKITDDYEIIFVDDGSPDDSLQKAVALYEKDSKIKVLELSRNFGHHKAIMTGLSYAKGDFIFLIDSDLEEEPELLGQFWEELNKDKDLDVVYGVQEKRKGGLFERWSGEIFYKIFNIISNVNIPPNLIVSRLTTQAYNQALISHKEREIFLAGLWFVSGFNQRPLFIKKHSKSKTSYTLRKKICMLINAITSFSNIPLVAIFYIGFFIFIMAVFYIGYIVLKWFFFSKTLEGWASLIASVWLLGGMIISFIGILGIYISKIFSETKQRPNTIIRQIYNRNQ